MPAPRVCRDRAATTPRRGARLTRAGFDDGEFGKTASARARKVQARKARRDWIVRAGETTAETPMWTSRDGWLTDLSAWLATDEGLAGCAQLHIRPERVLRAAVVLAAHADHGSGRHCAVTNATVAQAADCSERTVSTVRKLLSTAGLVRKLLSTAGLAVLAQQGHGSPKSARAGWRPAVWHLVSRPQPIIKPAAGQAFCDLRPSRRDGRVSLVGSQSPSARERARRPKSNPPARSPKRGRRCAPRPLHVQLLAADLVAHVRSLRHTHIGHICDALTASDLELDAWTGKSLQEALDADMKTRGWDWPERVERPGAFLLARLRLLPARPAKVQPGGLRAALQRRRHPVAHEPAGQTRQAEEARVARWNADVVAVTTPAQRAILLRAHEAKFGPVVDAFSAIAGAGRRAARMYPDLALADALTQWTTDVLGDAANTTAAEQGSAFTSLGRAGFGVHVPERRSAAGPGDRQVRLRGVRIRSRDRAAGAATQIDGV